MSKYDTSLESANGLLLESIKKLANLEKLNFFCKIQFYVVKMFAKKKFPKNDEIYILKSPWPCNFKYVNFAK